MATAGHTHDHTLLMAICFMWPLSAAFRRSAATSALTGVPNSRDGTAGTVFVGPGVYPVAAGADAEILQALCFLGDRLPKRFDAAAALAIAVRSLPEGS